MKVIIFLVIWWAFDGINLLKIILNLMKAKQYKIIFILKKN